MKASSDNYILAILGLLSILAILLVGLWLVRTDMQVEAYLGTEEVVVCKR